SLRPCGKRSRWLEELAPTDRPRGRPERLIRHRRIPLHHPLGFPAAQGLDHGRREAAVAGHRRPVVGDVVAGYVPACEQAAPQSFSTQETKIDKRTATKYRLVIICAATKTRQMPDTGTVESPMVVTVAMLKYTAWPYVSGCSMAST